MRVPAYLRHGMFGVDGTISGAPHYGNRKTFIMIDTGAETSVCIGGGEKLHDIRFGGVTIPDVFIISPVKGGEAMFENMVLLGMNFISQLRDVAFVFSPRIYFEIDPPQPDARFKVPSSVNHGGNRGREISRAMKNGNLRPLLEITFIVDPDCECIKKDTCSRDSRVKAILDTGSAVTTQNTRRGRSTKGTEPGTNIDRWDGKHVKMQRIPDACVAMASSDEYIQLDVQVPQADSRGKTYSNLSFIGNDALKKMRRLTILDADTSKPSVYVE